MKVTFYSVKKFKEYVDNVRKIQAEEIFEDIEKIRKLYRDSGFDFGEFDKLKEKFRKG